MISAQLERVYPTAHEKWQTNPWPNELRAPLVGSFHFWSKGMSPLGLVCTTKVAQGFMNYSSFAYFQVGGCQFNQSTNYLWAFGKPPAHRPSSPAVPLASRLHAARARSIPGCCVSFCKQQGAHWGKKTNNIHHFSFYARKNLLFWFCCLLRHIMT